MGDLQATEIVDPPPHVLLVSFPGQGHVNPLLRLAKRIAAKGPLVTFSSSLDIGRRLLASSSNPAPAEHDSVPIGKGRLRFDFFDDGLDVDYDLRNCDHRTLMAQISRVGPPSVAAIIRRQADAGRPVSCVVNNPFVPWVLDVAHDLGIPSAVLWIQSCAVFSAYHHYFHSLAAFPSVENPDVIVDLPGVPPMKPDELPTFLLPSCPYKPLRDAILAQYENLSKATWVFANSFEELEPDVIRSFSALRPPINIIPVGPLVDDSESEIKGDLYKAADCVGWLDAQEPNSVVYVSLGSVVTLTAEEMGEMASGLRGCGRPFIWVVRDKCRDLVPDGFEDDVKGKGMVVSWSPQELVLAHRSTACFLTHCGWNSTLEALTAGVPVIAYPQWGDQVPDAKFVVEEYGVGVKLEGPLKGTELAKRVDEVTEGKKAEEIRERASRWKEVAKKAMAEGGSSDRNIQAFVDEIASRSSAGRSPSSSSSND